jgi:hypothetical protein
VLLLSGLILLMGGCLMVAVGMGYGVGEGERAWRRMLRLGMEQQGQENALMLLDPPGTEYEVVGGNSLI